MSKPTELVLTLEPVLYEFVLGATKQGGFASISDYMNNIIRQRFETHLRQKLNDALDRGIADSKAGRVLPLEEAFEEIFSRLGLKTAQE